MIPDVMRAAVMHANDSSSMTFVLCTLHNCTECHMCIVLGITACDLHLPPLEAAS